MVLDAVMVLGVFEGDAMLREVGAEEPTEVMVNGMTLLAIDRHVSLTGVAPGGCS